MRVSDVHKYLAIHMVIESVLLGRNRWEGQMAHFNGKASSEQAYKR